MINRLIDYIIPSMHWHSFFGGDRNGIRPVLSEVLLWKTFVGPGLTWSTLWKNRLVKQEPEMVESGRLYCSICTCCEFDWYLRLCCRV